MIRKKSPYSFQINLPYYTAGEIIEWFEQMAANGTLSDQIIGMVFDNLNNITTDSYQPAVDHQPLPKVPECRAEHIKLAKSFTRDPCKVHSEVSISSEDETADGIPVTPGEPVTAEDTPNFLDHLYDWEGSNEAMVSDEPSISSIHGRKKMLSV